MIRLWLTASGTLPWNGVAVQNINIHQLRAVSTCKLIHTSSSFAKEILKKNTSKTTGKIVKLRDSVRAVVAKDGSSNDSTLNREMQQSPSIPYVRSWKSQSLFQNWVLSWMTVVIGCFRIPQDEICHDKKKNSQALQNNQHHHISIYFLKWTLQHLSVENIVDGLPVSNVQEGFWWDLATNCPAKFYPWTSALQNLGRGKSHRCCEVVWMGVAGWHLPKQKMGWEGMIIEYSAFSLELV